MCFDFASFLNSKKIIGYGAGIHQLSLDFPNNRHFDYIVDDNPLIIGKKINGLYIKTPKALLNEEKGRFVVIVNAVVPNTVRLIFSKLENVGLTNGVDFIDVSFFHFNSISKSLVKNLGLKTSYQKFEQIRKSALNSKTFISLPISGLWLMSELIDSYVIPPNDKIAEFGVFKGGSATCMLENSPKAQKCDYHLYDSFEGFPSIEDEDKRYQKKFRNILYEEVEKTFSNYENVKIRKGWFKDTFTHHNKSNFSFVHLDVDIYESTFHCLEVLIQSMRKGGLILVHDYCQPNIELPQGCWIPYKGAYRAVNQLIKKDNLILFPETLHALIKI